ncbi:MAG: hypothetical protein U0O22_00965 [Acutalibacteraceae bacterium]
MSCKCNTINIVNDNNIIVVSHADGRDGKSAYQQAVEGGYTGTEQEFNCSLSLLADVAEVKQQIADAIKERGGNANPNSAFTQLAQDIEEIPNFPTTGFEYISEIYRPRTLMEAYNSRYYLKSIVNNTIEEISGSYTFYSCASLQSVQFGSLERCVDPFSTTPNLRDITIQDADINLPFQNWTATNVINEGPSGIDELNTNLYNNLLTKLYDHSTDGQTRTLRLGWLAYVTQENIDYANSKGWTLTT